jgi:hypothetical protein
VCGKDNEYKLRLGPFVLRHHRINGQSKLPNGAKAVKSAAVHIQKGLFSDEWGQSEVIDNIILAIDVDVNKGLKEVFLGEIMPMELDSKKYKWIKKVPIFLADGAKASTADFILIADTPEFQLRVPEEDIVEVPVSLDKFRANQKSKKVKVTNDKQ